MNKQLYTVYDSKAGVYGHPTVARSKGDAIRSFTDAANNPEHIFCNHCEDFTLLLIGEFDEHSGTIIPISPAVTLGRAQEFKTQMEINVPEILKEQAD
jgi:hypothetical protein